MIVDINGVQKEINVLIETIIDDNTYYLYTFDSNVDLKNGEFFIGMEVNNSIVNVPEEDFDRIKNQIEDIMKTQ